MARTPLFSRLRRVARKVLWGHRHGITNPKELDEAWTAAQLERREFMKLGIGVMGAAAMPGLWAGCGDDDGKSNPPDASPPDGNPPAARVVIVGAGLAGIHCAYRLHEAGIKATVYDAADRFGGRTFTSMPMGPDNQIVELGGELIDTNHATMWALAETFELQLDDRWADEPDGYVRDVYFVNGEQIAESTIVEQFTAVAAKVAELYDLAENGDDTQFEEIDNTSIAEWLAENVPVDQYPELNIVLASAYRNEYGLENDQQSVLNLVYLIDFETPDPFRIFGDSDERYHTHTGNESFVKKLAEKLDAGQIVLQSRLTGLHDATGGAYRLEFTGADNSTFEVEADHVVLALPFTTLREVEITVSDFSAEKRTVISELGYGTNAKVMASFTSRLWRTQYNTSGSVVTDLPVQQTWDTTIGQDGTQGILTNFLGGEQGVKSGEGTANDWATQVMVPDLEQVFPGIQAQYVADSAVRMHWPTVPTHKGSYACYKPGQWQFWMTEGVRERNIHFCGEHCSAEFQGYMEGAAETGSVAAAEVLSDLGIQPSARHQQLLEHQLRLPHPCFHGDRLPRTRRWRAQRKLIRERLQRTQIELGVERQKQVRAPSK